MASPSRRSSTGIDRAASQSTQSQRPPDDYDYDLEAMGISDGYRPSDTGRNSSEHRPSNQRPQEHPAPRNTPPPRPLSTAKPKRNSFTLRHDGTMGPMAANTADLNTFGQPLSQSSISANHNASDGAADLERGPTDPSHAHHLYAQESGLGGIASTGTVTPTPMPEGSYGGPSRPIHPYGMYPQNTVPEPESAPQMNPIPIGFPGTNTYQPRRCPNEETADIVGPDGHTEQLPPYTQYPVDGSGRAPRPAAAMPLPTLSILPGAGGIGLATRNPEFESRENLGSPPSRQSTLSDSSSRRSNTNTQESLEKPQLKKWQRVARKRICAIVPIWAVALAAVVLVLLIVVSSVIMAAHHKGDTTESGTSKQNVTYTTMVTTTFDALPFATLPTGIPPVPTGTFALPITAPATAQSGCIVNPAQSIAWSCAIPPSPLQMSLQAIPGGGSLMNKEVSLNYGNNSLGCVFYGAQPPVLNKPAVLSLVTDAQNPNRGPAWYFQTPYDKVVILESDALSLPATTLNSKRSPAQGANSPFQYLRKGTALPGDTPWFCYWNGTILEYFIYTSLSSSSAAQGNSSSSNSPTPISSSAGSSYTQASATASASGDSSAGWQPSNLTTGWWATDSIFLPGYPKVIKVEERRQPSGHQSIHPYCVQHTINNDGSAAPLMVDGEPVQIFLNETEPATVPSLPDKRDLDERADSCCGCVWLST